LARSSIPFRDPKRSSNMPAAEEGL
jgi:hypothetical protein